MISVSHQETKIISSIVSWHLYIPDDLGIPSSLNEDESQILRIILNELNCQLCFCRHGADSISIEIGEKYLCSDGRMQLPLPYFHLIIKSAAHFLERLQHSPVEIEALTGVPASCTSSLVERMQSFEKGVLYGKAR